MNPHYGFSKFHKENVWWHAQSYWVLGRLPVDYFVGWGISLVLALVASKFGTSWALIEQVMLLAGLSLLTLLTIVLSPYYHTWYWWMRARDDRDDAGIRH